jgi:hypothetical protein
MHLPSTAATTFLYFLLPVFSLPHFFLLLRNGVHAAEPELEEPEKWVSFAVCPTVD